MKKGKKFGKVQIALAVMVIALGAAVWLNMRYTSADTEAGSDTSSKYLGDAEYVNATVSEKEDEEKNNESDYFTKLRNDRKKARDEALSIIEDTLDRDDLTEAQKAEAVAQSTALSKAAEQEAAVETLLRAKGFQNVVVVIGEVDVNVIVEKTPDAAGVAKIQDAVAAQTDFNAADVKIISTDQ